MALGPDPNMYAPYDYTNDPNAEMRKILYPSQSPDALPYGTHIPQSKFDVLPIPLPGESTVPTISNVDNQESNPVTGLNPNAAFGRAFPDVPTVDNPENNPVTGLNPNAAFGKAFPAIVNLGISSQSSQPAPSYDVNAALAKLPSGAPYVQPDSNAYTNQHVQQIIQDAKTKGVFGGVNLNDGEGYMIGPDGKVSVMLNHSKNAENLGTYTPGQTAANGSIADNATGAVTSLNRPATPGSYDPNAIIHGGVYEVGDDGTVNRWNTPATTDIGVSASDSIPIDPAIQSKVDNNSIRKHIAEQAASKLQSNLDDLVSQANTNGKNVIELQKQIASGDFSGGTKEGAESSLAAEWNMLQKAADRANTLKSKIDGHKDAIQGYDTQIGTLMQQNGAIYQQQQKQQQDAINQYNWAVAHPRQAAFQAAQLKAQQEKDKAAKDAAKEDHATRISQSKEYLDIANTYSKAADDIKKANQNLINPLTGNMELPDPKTAYKGPNGLAQQAKDIQAFNDYNTHLDRARQASTLSFNTLHPNSEMQNKGDIKYASRLGGVPGVAGVVENAIGNFAQLFQSSQNNPPATAPNATPQNVSSSSLVPNVPLAPMVPSVPTVDTSSLPLIKGGEHQGVLDNRFSIQVGRQGKTNAQYKKEFGR
jgi:hypothetical protein